MTDDYTPIDPVLEPQLNQKKGNNTLIIAIIAIVVLCCCCVVVTGYLGWTYGDAFLDALGITY